MQRAVQHFHLMPHRFGAAPLAALHRAGDDDGDHHRDDGDDEEDLDEGETAAGAKWLALSPHDRLALLVDPIRNSKEVNPPGVYDRDGQSRFFSFSLQYLEAPKTLHLRDALTRAFLAAGDGFIPLEQFLQYHALENNPLHALSSSSATDPLGLMYYGAGDPRESYRSLWRSALVQFLASRLFAFGGASIGRLNDGALCFALTDVGRYLLGAADSFAYGTSVTADVVIQPNFDVVFLGIAPSVEATIARFAERVGNPPGLAFKITQRSVFGASETGMTSAEVIDSLTAVSSKPVPKNVQREIAGWMAAVRRASLRRVEVIECADEESAGRVLTLLGAKVRQLTGTMFELRAATGSARAATLKKLRAGGVFVSDATVQVEVRARVRPQYQEEWEEE